MLLSEAIILGDSLKRCDPHTWLSDDGSCGCAFGGALLATGVTAEQYFRECLSLPFSPLTDTPLVKHRWPWLTEEHLIHISGLYMHVALGGKTIEDVAAYVRTIEPPEYESDYRDEQGITDAPAELEIGRYQK